MQNREILIPGTLMKHFKGMIYQIIAIATHSESREDYVVYQALYGEYKTFIRPLDMFLSEVDHVKYPNVEQKYRFEVYKPNVKDTTHKDTQLKEDIVNQEVEGLVRLQSIDNQNVQHSDELAQKEFIENPTHKALLEFLDARTYKDKLEILDYIKNKVDSQMVNSMAMAMDLTLATDTVEEQIDEIKNCLMTHMRFEDRRLR